MILDHKFANLMDEPVSLCQFSGKVLLIVNTASNAVTRRSTKAWKNYIAAIATKASPCSVFPPTTSVAKNPDRTRRSRNFAG